MIIGIDGDVQAAYSRRSTVTALQLNRIGHTDHATVPVTGAARRWARVAARVAALGRAVRNHSATGGVRRSRPEADAVARGVGRGYLDRVRGPRPRGGERECRWRNPRSS